jgi:formate/nitrite transporter
MAAKEPERPNANGGNALPPREPQKELVKERPAPAMFGAYAPGEIAQGIEEVGIAKAEGALLPIFALAFLAGAYIALGAMFYTLVMTGADASFGPARMLGGIAFSLGLILVLVGGAELFTGNVLIVLDWAAGRVGTGALLRNWGIVYVGNFVGALGMAGLAWWAGIHHIGGDGVARTALGIAGAKEALPFWTAFVRGILCNVLVCMAVWLCFAARDVASKVLAIVFPIAAFVALGFEHSIANMFFLPYATLLSLDPALAAKGVSLAGLVRNLVPVTLGNIVGGGVFVALSYFVIYRRGRR